MKLAPPIFLIRHPKPNISPGICYGSSDIQPQAAALQATFLWLDSFLSCQSRIISSPLARCAQLASLLCANLTRTCEFDGRLAERSGGGWELQHWDNIPRSEIDAWASDFIDYCAPGAESVRQMQTRVLAAWADYTQSAHQSYKNPKALALISHAGPIQVLLAHLTGVELSAKPIVEIACGAAVLLKQKKAGWSFEVRKQSS